MNKIFISYIYSSAKENPYPEISCNETICKHNKKGICFIKELNLSITPKGVTCNKKELLKRL